MTQTNDRDNHADDAGVMIQQQPVAGVSDTGCVLGAQGRYAGRVWYVVRYVCVESSLCCDACNSRVAPFNCM